MRKKEKQKKRHSEKKRIIDGKFSATPTGYGFVTPDNGTEDIFIPAKYVGSAIDGDRVKVEISKESELYSGKGPVGIVVSVLEHNRDFIVAELNSKHQARPLNKRLPQEIKVGTLPKGVKPGNWVRLRLLDDGKKHTEQLRGSVEKQMGKAGTVEADLYAVCEEFGLAEPYTEAQNEEAAKLKQAEIEREDCTNLFTLTIDPADAHDFDDAISIMPTEKKTVFQLGVHIADVAAWIRPNTKFDKEAAKRSFSSYIPGMFRPMLPKTLTALISLRENIVAPAHSILFTVRKTDGKILSSRRIHTTIKVNKRLNFNEVQKFIEIPSDAPTDWSEELKNALSSLVALTRKMHTYRKKTEEFLAIETSEIRAVCDEKTKEVLAIERKIPCEADRIVEDCMLAANSAVAAELIERKIPGLFRIHPEPTPEKIAEFSDLTERSFGLHTGDLLSSRTACSHFLESLPDDHRKAVILSNFLRALPRASYLSEPELHYGLGKYRYSHFTSPIRRYPDLAVHQQLWASDTNTRMRSKKMLEEIADDSTVKEENTDNAFFEANDRLKIHFLKSHGALENATMYEAVITKISTAGLVADISELGIYGFVPRHLIRGGDYFHVKNAGKLRSTSGHKQYKIGDFIYLVLDSIDLVRGTAIFRPAL